MGSLRNVLSPPLNVRDHDADAGLSLVTDSHLSLWLAGRDHCSAHGQLCVSTSVSDQYCHHAQYPDNSFLKVSFSRLFFLSMWILNKRRWLGAMRQIFKYLVEREKKLWRECCVTDQPIRGGLGGSWPMRGGDSSMPRVPTVVPIIPANTRPPPPSPDTKPCVTSQN